MDVKTKIYLDFLPLRGKGVSCFELVLYCDLLLNSCCQLLTDKVN